MHIHKWRLIASWRLIVNVLKVKGERVKNWRRTVVGWRIKCDVSLGNLNFLPRIFSHVNFNNNNRAHSLHIRLLYVTYVCECLCVNMCVCARVSACVIQENLSRALDISLFYSTRSEFIENKRWATATTRITRSLLMSIYYKCMYICIYIYKWGTIHLNHKTRHVNPTGRLTKRQKVVGNSLIIFVLRCK